MVIKVRYRKVIMPASVARLYLSVNGIQVIQSTCYGWLAVLLFAISAIT